MDIYLFGLIGSIAVFLTTLVLALFFYLGDKIESYTE